MLWGLSLIRAVRAEGSMEGYLLHTKKAAGIADDPEKKLQCYLGGRWGKDKDITISRYIPSADGA